MLADRQDENIISSSDAVGRAEGAHAYVAIAIAGMQGIVGVMIRGTKVTDKEEGYKKDATT